MNRDLESESQRPTVIDIDVMGILQRRGRHIGLGLTLGIALGVIHFIATTSQFESELEILVGQRSSEMTTRGTANDGYASGSTIQEDVLATHLDILTSKKVLHAAVETSNLANLYSFKRASKKSVSPVQHILRNLSVARGGDGPVKEANVITARYRDPRPEDAALVLNAIYESYKTYIEGQWKDHSGEAVRLLQQARETNEKELADADVAYRSFVQSVPVFVDGEKMSDVHRDRLNKMEAELNDVRSSIAETRSRLSVIRSCIDKAGQLRMTDLDRLALLSENEIQRLKLFVDMTRGNFQSEEFVAAQPARVESARAQYNRLLDLYQKHRQYKEAFGSSHPLVQSAAQEIEVIENFISESAPDDEPTESVKQLSATEMLTAYQQLLTHDEAALTIREKTLLESVNRELAVAKSVESDFLQGSSLKAKLDRAQYRYDEVVRRLQEIEIAGNFAGFSTDLLATPHPAIDPCWPKLPLSLVVGLMLGGLFGMATGMIAEISDRTFRDAKDLERATGATILTHVAPFDMHKLRQMVDRDSEIAPQLCAFHGPRSQESEVYRTARTSVLLDCRQQNRKAIMMTSPVPGDGKSTTISNLAISLAQTGKRILLIDADLRRPTIYKIFGANGNPGVTDVIEGVCGLDLAVQESEQENLSLLTHGTRTSTPAEVLESHQFANLLDQARSTYDIVLVDAPPVLAVTDPAIIAPNVDGVLMTIQIRRNARRPVERACEALRDINVTPIGIIVNNSDTQQQGYGYSHDYYGEAYGYIGKYYDDYSAPAVPKPKGRYTSKPRRQAQLSS